MLEVKEDTVEAKLMRAHKGVGAIMAMLAAFDAREKAREVHIPMAPASQNAQAASLRAKIAPPRQSAKAPYTSPFASRSSEERKD